MTREANELVAKLADGVAASGSTADKILKILTDKGAFKLKECAADSEEAIEELRSEIFETIIQYYCVDADQDRSIPANIVEVCVPACDYVVTMPIEVK